MSYPPQNQSYPPPNQGYPPAQYPGTNYPPPQGMAYQPSPQQYPQQQVYYQPQPQGYPGYVQPQQPAVFIQPQPVQPVRFEYKPVRCQCPHCHAVVDSKVKREVGTTTCLHCLFFSFVCCCCVPFCLDCSKDASHYCPNCKKHLATFKQPALQSGGGGGGGFRRPSREGPGPWDGGSVGGGSAGGGSGGGGDD